MQYLIRNIHIRQILFSLFTFCLAAVATPSRAAPPFLTDDAETLSLHQKEVYLFSSYDKTYEGKVIQAPAIEFNYGATPDLMIHLVIPITMVYPSDAPVEKGLGDIELGMKYRFVHESSRMPGIAVYPVAVLPTGDSSRGTGNGQAWYRIPVWASKSWGAWTLAGGGGYAINHAPGARDYAFAGTLLLRAVSPALTLGAELFRQQADRNGAAGATYATFGGYYSIDSCHCQLLLDLGHTIAGESHTVGYLGLYWAWGSPFID